MVWAALWSPELTARCQILLMIKQGHCRMDSWAANRLTETTSPPGSEWAMFNTYVVVRRLPPLVDGRTKARPTWDYRGGEHLNTWRQKLKKLSLPFCLAKVLKFQKKKLYVWEEFKKIMANNRNQLKTLSLRRQSWKARGKTSRPTAKCTADESFGHSGTVLWRLDTVLGPHL